MDTYVGLKLSELTAVEVKGENYLAFAKDIDGHLLCIRVSGQETVVVYDCNDCTIDEDHKLNYGQYLESIRDKLLTKKIAYEEGLGLVNFA